MPLSGSKTTMTSAWPGLWWWPRQERTRKPETLKQPLCGTPFDRRKQVCVCYTAFDMKCNLFQILGRPRYSAQRRLAFNLMRDCGLQGQCGLTELQKFQDFLEPDYQIKVQLAGAFLYVRVDSSYLDYFKISKSKNG